MAKSPNEVPRSNEQAFNTRMVVMQGLIDIMVKHGATEDDVQRALQAIRVMSGARENDTAKGGFRN